MAIASHQILVGDVLEKLAELPEKSVHCCLTSPPYWGLRDYGSSPQIWGGNLECEHDWGATQAKPGSVYRQHLAADFAHREDKHTIAEAVNASDGGQFCCCGAWRGSLGLEPTIDLFVQHLVEVFSAVRRVLRDDATLWVNLGDSYTSTAEGTVNTGERLAGRDSEAGMARARLRPVTGLKPLDLCNVPHRVASALQADGWYWRSTIIWAKGLSFCDSYSGSVMPESVNGWRFEKQDDGEYKLRKGSWRCTSAYEFVFQFAKSKDYYADGEAVREQQVYDGQFIERQTFDGKHTKGSIGQDAFKVTPEGGRNLRNVWVINPQPFPDAHFATFPEKLVEPIIKAATSDKGVCPECGAPWARVIETIGRRGRDYNANNRAGGDRLESGRSSSESAPEITTHTLDWRQTCRCSPYIVNSELRPKPIPATVLDPFTGSGTSLLVARKLGRDSIGIELNAEYAQMAEKRLAGYAPLFT